ncbi:MAG: acyltransferase family protein [Actinomycetota bacterium]
MSHPEPSAVSFERLPAIDGMRAIAVYLVVAFHAGVVRFEGGFVGVDVFFVLSGFLITRLLIVEFASTGRVDVVGFYARRARRLLPAAWLAVAITSIVFVAFSNPAERATALDDAQAAIFYFANWHFIGSSQDYFAESIASSPFLHLWSLAVEEQFYLVWPVLSLGLLAMWRRRPVLVTGFVVVATLAAGGWALSVAESDLLRAYYGTDTRAYQLLGGAALAFVLSRPDGSGRRFLHERTSGGLVAGGLGLLLLVSVVDGVDAVDRGMYAAVLTVIVVAAIAAREPGPVALPERVLATRSMVTLGGLSYGTYLWHWPLVILLQRTLVLSPTTTLVVVALASTGLAKLSMDLVEMPIRRRSHGATRRANAGAVSLGLAGTLAIGLVAVPGVLQADVDQIRAADRAGYAPPPVTVTVPVEVVVEVEAAAEPERNLPDAEPAAPTAAAVIESRPRPAPATTGPVPADLGAVPIESSFGERDGCVNSIPSDIAECLVVDGAGARVMLLGDSHGSKLNIAFAEYAATNDLAYAVSTSNGCAWQQILRYRDAIPAEGAKQACAALRDAAYDVLIEQFRPDVVVVVSHDFATDGYAVEPRPDIDATAGLAGDELISVATAAAADSLTAYGAELVIIEPIPSSSFDVADCLSGATVIEDCQFIAGDWPTSDTVIYRELAAARDDVRTVDMTDLACPAFPICSAIVDGVQVREDRDHLYGAYALSIGDELLTRIGL